MYNPGMDVAEGIAGRLARFAVHTAYEDLPDEVVGRAKLAIIDGLSCIGSGSSTSLAGIADTYGQLQQDDSPRSVGPQAFPRSKRYVNWQVAGFVCGVYSFSQNYGDTSLISVAHPGSVVLPSILLAAQRSPVSGREMVAATAIGYEAVELFARELNGGNPKMAMQIKGFRPTPTCGPIGVVAAVGRVLGLNEETVRNALGIIVNHAAGLRRTGGHPLAAIRVQSGTAVSLGLAAIDLGQSGVVGDPFAFEAPGGFLSAFDAPEGSAQRIAQRLAAGPGAPWGLMHTAVKLHCTPQTLSTALDCLLDIRAEHAVEPDQIERVEIRVPSAHWSISGTPKGVMPETSGAAAAHYPYCAAVVLRTGDWIWPEMLSKHLADPAVAALADKVDIVVDDELTERFDNGKELWPAEVDVWVGGNVFRQRMSYPRGTKSDEVSREAVRRKATVLARSWPQPPDVDKLVAFADGIEASDDIYRDLVAATGLADTTL
jgi:2-methylcitrate dehydratase PrpD